MRQKITLCGGVFCTILLFVSHSWGAENGGTGRGNNQSMNITEKTENNITVNQEGNLKKISLTANIKIYRQTVVARESLILNAPVIIQGQTTTAGRLKAKVLVWLSPWSYEQAQLAGGRGNTFIKNLGRIVSLTPLKIALINSTNQLEVDIDEQSLLFKEEPATAADLHVGDKIRLQHGKIVILPAVFQKQRADKSGSFHLPEAPLSKVSHFNATVVKNTEKSPFGFFDPNMLRFQHLSFYDDFAETIEDIGVHWASFGATFSFNWNLIQDKAGDGKFKWDRVDRLIKLTQDHNIHVIGYIKASPPGGEDFAKRGGHRIPSLPENMDAYKAFAAAVVERYDGDGVSDMPDLKLPIKYWSVEDEPMAPIYFSGTGKDYANLFYGASQAIKSADSDAIVIVSMLRGTGWLKKAGDPRVFMEDFFRQLSLLTKETPYDILDQHWLGAAMDVSQAKQYEIYEGCLQDVENTAALHGFKKVPFVNLEMAGFDAPESNHAADLIKRHVFLLSLGVKKILWSGIKAAPAQGLSKEQTENYFRRITLIDGEDQRKLAYWSYKLMVEVLDGADWSKTKSLKKDQDGVFVFEFIKNGKPIWVMWNDNNTKEETLYIPTKIKTVAVIRAVPNAESGRNVKSYDDAFPLLYLKVTDGQIKVNIDSTPVFIFGTQSEEK